MKPDAVQGFLRECLGFERDLGSHPFDPPLQRAGANEAVTRAGIWSAQSTEVVSEGTLLATQLMRGARERVSRCTATLHGVARSRA
jgi:hypothetical protein